MNVKFLQSLFGNILSQELSQGFIIFAAVVVIVAVAVVLWVAFFGPKGSEKMQVHDHKGDKEFLTNEATRDFLLNLIHGSDKGYSTIAGDLLGKIESIDWGKGVFNGVAQKKDGNTITLRSIRDGIEDLQRMTTKKGGE